MPASGKLYIIPTVIADNTSDDVLPARVRTVLASLRHFLAEDVRTARRSFSRLKVFERIEDLQFSVLDKDTSDGEIPMLLEPLLNGISMGLVSESGCPGVADPGSKAVNFAHQQNIPVIPLVGPSSILLALMASGLNGQQFAFHGYLPVESKELSARIKELEKESRAKKQTQIFIETPYRNNSLFEQLLKNLGSETQLCVAIDLTGQKETVSTRRVSVWREQTISWPKEPMVCLFLS